MPDKVLRNRKICYKCYCEHTPKLEGHDNSIDWGIFERDWYNNVCFECVANGSAYYWNEEVPKECFFLVEHTVNHE